MQLATWRNGGPGRGLGAWREVAAFGAVGALAFVTEFAVFNLLVLYLRAEGGFWGATPALASALATLCAMAVSWFGNRHWTFRDRRAPVARREVAWFLAVNLLGLVVTAAPIYLAHEVLGLSTPLAYNLARLTGWVAASALRFITYRNLVFRSAVGGSQRAPH
ncbi:GtrA family protein [Streptomyces sp. NBC_01264]|uniref:GtrA family protein n=1 Tax=Streptomyces sp. NBC_01264 TaxID=2903804 RepID=UPI00224E30C3|nr:GtrA family protein [Streptomyces sp. NBC_01264]MCX4784405.1 GtrA family protein [Streptomyces sp. NBC_01264]